MLFHLAWVRRDGSASEEADRRILAILEKFEPPAGVTIHAWVERADGTGGYGILETDDPGALAAAPPIFGPYYSFEATPVLQHADWVAVAAAAVSFRDGIG